MAAILELDTTITVNSRRAIQYGDDRPRIYVNHSGGTVYYDNSPTVSSSSNDGSIANGASYTSAIPLYFITSGSTMGDLYVYEDISEPDTIVNVSTAVTDDTYASKLSGDANNRFVINADGKLEWGNGTDAVDTNLYRSAASTLKTDSSFKVGSNITLVPGAGEVYATRYWGLGALSTDNTINSTVSGDAYSRLTVDAAGIVKWGSGSTTPDTNLYRASANRLATDDRFTVYADAGATAFDVQQAAEGQPRFYVDGDGALKWTSGATTFDTNLYRSAADTLKTDDAFTVTGALTASNTVIMDGAFAVMTAGFFALTEIAAPTGFTNQARLYAKDNGAGKTQLCVIFPSGAEQVLSTEP